MFSELRNLQIVFGLLPNQNYPIGKISHILHVKELMEQPGITYFVLKRTNVNLLNRVQEHDCQTLFVRMST